MDFSKTIIRRLAPAAAALVVFFVVSAAYFAPQFRGEVLPQHDVVQYEGMAKDISDMRAATGEDPQWTGGMFGGMPAFLINVAYPAQIVKRTVGQVVKLIDTPAAFLFFAMTAMWLMLLVFGVDPWVGIVPALAYGLSTYFLLIIGAGHITKMWALVYAPLMMGGAWMTLRGNMWAGGALTALTASLEIVALATIFVLNAIALFIFPVLGHMFGLDQQQFGTWAAIAIHDTSSVVGAGAAYGEEALKVATTIKLTRALWIIPLAFATSFIFKGSGKKVSIPWFILYFVVAIILNTYVLDGVPQFGQAVSGLARKGLIITMFFIGASLSMDVLKQVGMKPLIQGFALWAVIVLTSLAYILLF